MGGSEAALKMLESFPSLAATAAGAGAGGGVIYQLIMDSDMFSGSKINAISDLKQVGLVGLIDEWF